MAMVLLAGVLPLLVSLAARSLYGAVPHVNEQVHAAFELAGTAIALCVAMLLMLRADNEDVSPHVVWIIAALVAMGLVDGFHSLVSFGIAWSWLRHTATLIGGVLFGLVWVTPPPAWLHRTRSFIFLVAMLSMGWSLIVWQYPGWLPGPWVSGDYSIWVKASNALGGLGFFAAALFFLHRYTRRPLTEDWVFASHTLLFGGSGLFFGFSTVWAADWWTWHVARLTAYAVVLVAAYVSVATLYERIATQARALEESVQSRTAELQLRNTQLAAEIAERTRLEENLRESEALAVQHEREVEELYRNAPVGLCFLDRDLRYVKINQRLAEINGIPAAEHIGRTVREIVPDLADQAEPLFRRVLETGEPRFNVELQGETPAKPGVIRSWVESWVPVPDGKGAVAGINVMALEVTERKRAESEVNRLNADVRQRVAELRASEERFHEAFASAPVGMTLTATDGRLLQVNRRLCEMVGYTVEELTSGSFAAITHPDDVAASREFIRSALAGQRSGGRFEKRYLRKDGSILWAEVSSTLLRDSIGRPLHFVTHIQDITARVEAEQARTRLAAIVESSDDAIIGKTLDGVITSWNHGAEKIYGWAADEVVGKSVAVLIPSEHHDEVPAFLARIAGGESIEHYETVRVRKDGQRIEVSLTLSPMRDAAGRLVGASTIARDVTAQRQAEKRIRALNAELGQRTSEVEATNKELEAFSYSVSHDLRAPLRAIDGFSQALVQDHAASLDAEARAYLGRVRAGVQHMGQLIDDLLKLSRVTRAEFSPGEVDLSALARAVLDELQRQDPGRKVETVVAERLSARADRRLARVLLDNLLGNAWKFTSKTKTAHVEFGSAAAGNGATAFFVRDNGAGFDMAYAGKLFEAFQRLHPRGDFEGTGIGLATVRRIVHRHGGQVWAEGEVGKGATFWFTLAAPLAARSPGGEAANNGVNGDREGDQRGGADE